MSADAKVVERVSAGIFDEYSLIYGKRCSSDNARRLAARAIEAYRAALSESGYVIVPRESTAEMNDAGQYTDYAEFYIESHDAEGVWDRMIDEALK